jgi:uridine kinase
LIRISLLELIATEIAHLARTHVTFVGVDGVDGSGKTMFADELGGFIKSVPVIRASVDGFHNPRAVRYARGRTSPEGFFEDSYNYELMKTSLLDPLGAGGSLEYCDRAFDYLADRPVDAPLRKTTLPSILLIDGIFLHRPELRSHWHYSIFLDVDRREALRRCNVRDGHPERSTDTEDPVHARYVRGQDLYLAQCAPQRLATRVVDNTDLQNPSINQVAWDATSPTSR